MPLLFTVIRKNKMKNKQKNKTNEEKNNKKREKEKRCDVIWNEWPFALLHSVIYFKCFDATNRNENAKEYILISLN